MFSVAHKGFPKHQPLTMFIQNELDCRLEAELDSKNLNMLSNYVKGLKVDFLVPNQPNTKRSYKVVGLLDTASKFMCVFLTVLFLLLLTNNFYILITFILVVLSIGFV